MKIDWTKMSSDDFEELCWHILEVNGFQSLEWLGRSGDRGRDIVAIKTESPFPGFEDQRVWIVQCKRYSLSPSPADLDKSIAWARAHRPDYFLIILPCVISPGTRDWLNTIQSGLPFRILVCDKPHLESQLRQHFEWLEPYLPDDIRKEVKKFVPSKVPFIAPTPLTTSSMHMKVLREQAIDPWISSLRGAQKNFTFVAGGVRIESCAIGFVAVNHEIVTELPSDPEFKYSKELFEHLSSGYPEQYAKWKDLKEEYGGYLQEAEDFFKVIVDTLVNEITKKTGLNIYNLRGQPSDGYFIPSYLSYIIYSDLYTKASTYGPYRFREMLEISQDEHKKGVYYLSCGAFSRLVQGTWLQVDHVRKVILQKVRDREYTQWMQLHLLKKRKLDDDFTQFVRFLESLSKLIENGKPIGGTCKICQSD